MGARRGSVRVASLTVATLLLVGLALPGCASQGDDTVITARIRSTQAERSRLEGSWPQASTTTTAPPTLDPATGLSISGPIGPPWPEFFVAADAIVDDVALYESPGKRVPTGRTLPNPTHEGVPLVMLVRKVGTGDGAGYLQVQINQRPNGATAWIKRSDVKLRFVPHHILIELGARRLTVFRGEKEVWSTSVAPGKASSPTPLGAFYVDVLAKPHSPNGPYGAYQISFTGFSEVYTSFGGGNGQVAMHGTNRPELIGTPASHGCVRLSNPDITHLLGLAPQGTPVVVVA